MFLKQGNEPSLFWELSIGEVKDILENRAIAKENELREQIILNEVLANQVFEKVARIANNDVTYTHLYDYFPDLFEPEKEVDNTMDLYKAQMEDYAWKHNYRKVGENNGRNDT